MINKIHLRILVIIFTCLLAFPLRAQSPQDESVLVGWLGGEAPGINCGVSWGVPWPKGVVKKGQNFSLFTSDGKPLPLQTWPLAYWPDGSLKWSGFTTVEGVERQSNVAEKPRF